MEVGALAWVEGLGFGFGVEVKDLCRDRGSVFRDIRSWVLAKTDDCAGAAWGSHEGCRDQKCCSCCVAAVQVPKAVQHALLLGGVPFFLGPLDKLT